MSWKLGQLLGGMAFVIGGVGMLFVLYLPPAVAGGAALLAMAGLALYGVSRAALWLKG